jgi:hypothetical protein
MDNKTITITVDGPILSGTVYKSKVKCGKANCRCALEPAQRHLIYQWSGNINGKNTSRALTEEMFVDCKKRIENYKKLKRLFLAKVNQGLKTAPWAQKKR